MKLIPTLTVFVALYGKVIMSAPEPGLASTRKCSDRMKSDLPESFTAVVAHGSHSLHKEDVDFYFPTEKAEINLPVINPDLLSNTPILSHPAEFKHSFKSPALRALDQVLSHMNSPDYDIKNYSDLERIAHVAHMQDMWLEASRAYSELQQPNSGVDESLCACIRDVENNGIMQNLRQLALEIREPELMQRKAAPTCGYRFSYLFRYRFRGFCSLKHSKAYANETMKHDDERNQDLKEAAEIQPELTNTKAWNVWKEMMIADQPDMREHGKQLALYMHCMIQ